MDDTRVHDALERLAADAPARSDAVWERTQQRIARRRRMRVFVTGAVVVALLLGAAGVVAAVRSNNDGDRVAATRGRRAATPTTVSHEQLLITVPNVVGLEASGAQRRLEGLGFRMSATGSGRSVYSQRPDAGATAARGSTVVVDTCPPTALCVSGAIAVPDFRGMSATAADAERQRLGLDGGVTVEKSHGTSRDDTKVFWQDPPPGTLRNALDDIRIWACPNTERCVSPPQDFVDSGQYALGWRPVAMSDSPWTTFVGRQFDTPEALASAIVADIERAPDAPKTVTYTIMDRGADSAHVWVQTRNMPDDSIDGVDYEFSVTRGRAKWTLHDGRVRTVCARGVASADSCL